MSIQRDRKRILVRGLGTIEVRQIDPTPDTYFADAGYLLETTVTDAVNMVMVTDENGNPVNMIAQDRRVSFLSKLQQSTQDEINLLRNSLSQLHAVRYYGSPQTDRWQYFCAEVSRLTPSVGLPYKPGLRTLDLAVEALNRNDELGFSVPEYHYTEARSAIRAHNVKFWVDPRLGYNAATAKLLDISGWAYHGTISANFASIWQTGTPDRFLRFNGTADQASHGNYLNDDGSDDKMFECWLRFPGSAGTQEEVLSKKALVSDNSAGWALSRNASNQLVFRVGSGAGSAAVISTSTVTTTWVHFAVTVSRAGNMQIYINGAADGSPVAVSAIGSGTNALNILLASDGTNSGQVDLGIVRIHSFGAAALPSDIASWIAKHYSGERAYYGV